MMLQVLAVWASGPTARTAHSFFELRTRPLYTAASRFRLLGLENPTDPLIPRQGCYILPSREYLGVGNKNFL